MKLKCRHCNGRLGLGITSARVWHRYFWGFVMYRFCSSKCRDTHLQARQAALDRERAVHQLFHPPPVSEDHPRLPEIYP